MRGGADAEFFPRCLPTGPWWVLDTDNAEMFTLPTEVPGAVAHLQEMRELFYRRRVAMRQQQLQRQEEERRRLEKEAFEARRQAAAAEEKKRKAAAAAEAKIEKARLAAAASKRGEKKLAKEAGAAAAVPPAVQVVQKKEEQEKEAEEKKKEQGLAKEMTEEEEREWRHHKEAKQHEEEVTQQLTGLMQPPQPATSKGGVQEDGSRMPAPDAVKVIQPTSAARPVQELASGEAQRQQHPGEETYRTFGAAATSATTGAQKVPLSTTGVHNGDGGVPLHAAPLLSRRLLTLTRH